jgi:hypothetical protein
MDTTTNTQPVIGYVNALPHELYMGDLTFIRGSAVFVTAIDMTDDHFAFTVNGLQWDFVDSTWVPFLNRPPVPGSESLRVAGKEIRELFKLGPVPTIHRAWDRTYRTTNYQNDPMHNYLP